MKLTKTEQKLIAQAKKSFRNQISVTLKIGKNDVGGRDYKAAKSLIKKGLAIKTNYESHRPIAWSTVSYHTITIKLVG